MSVFEPPPFKCACGKRLATAAALHKHRGKTFACLQSHEAAVQALEGYLPCHGTQEAQGLVGRGVAVRPGLFTAYGPEWALVVLRTPLNRAAVRNAAAWRSVAMRALLDRPEAQAALVTTFNLAKQAQREWRPTDWDSVLALVERLLQETGTPVPRSLTW